MLVNLCFSLLILVWLLQAKASQQQGTLVHRELHKQAYNDALVQRYQHLPDVKRIQRHRHLPAPLYKACYFSGHLHFTNTICFLLAEM